MSKPPLFSTYGACWDPPLFHSDWLTAVCAVMATGGKERSDPDTSTPSNNGTHKASHAGYFRSRSISATSILTSAIKAGGDREPDGTSAASKSIEQEDARWTQAHCNVAMLFRVVIEGCICWAVYCVLESFFHPLLWAILIGTILHPFKKTGTDLIKRWLEALRDSHIPL